MGRLIMFKHILVPLDGSHLAESALPVVSYLAGTLGASVTLFHVIEKDAPKAIHGETHLSDPDRANEYLKTIAAKSFAADIRVSYHVHVAEARDVARSIVEHEQEFTHDLIVMCTHGRGRALHLLLGSIAQHVTNLGRIPVLIVHPESGGDKKAFSCTSVLLPIDESGHHEQVMPIARDFAVACRATLHLIMVIQTFGTVSGNLTSATRFLPGTTAKMLELAVENAEEYLQDQQIVLEAEGLTVTADVLRGDSAEGIVDAAQKLNVDVIILGTHGKSGLDAVLSGSVANKVCSQCHVPMLLVPVDKT
jgi:nucleotide-binding universal stress UspA family protein